MYSELQVTTNFSFLRGASHPHELVWRAAELGYSAIGITDFNTLSGIVRAHTAARDAKIQLLVGCCLEIDFQGQIRHKLTERSSPYHQALLLVYPTSKTSYGSLCRLLTLGKHDVTKSDFFLSLADFLPYQDEFVTILVPPFFQTRFHNTKTQAFSSSFNSRYAIFFELCKIIRENSKDTSLLSVALTNNYGLLNPQYVDATLQIARSLDISIVATNDVYYHTSQRKPLQDALTCIRLGCTIQQAGFSLFQNSERFLKPPDEMQRLFRNTPHAIRRTQEIAEIASQFSLSSLRYTYPNEICPQGRPAHEYLHECVQRGARERYPRGIPAHVADTIEQELRLIRELEYERYFLTCHDIVRYARSRGILCQGRGAAANSVVCFCLGITSVDPTVIDLLFARFVSKERREPPDIDIDFEHERREEVIQYIYSKYGRDRAALTAEVVTYRARSAVREIGKVLGLSLEMIDRLAKSVHRWTDCEITVDTLRELGLNPFDSTIQNTIALSSELVGFPRHLSQHVGGFVICNDPLCEIVPIINASMQDRTIIEWDKNDIEELGMLKIDVLGLGMLTCIRKALELVNCTRSEKLELHSIPPEDPAVYEMLCASDTIGVFQVESRAQMSMLPRLRPQCFYDLVIEVAIVRPGPIQGNMVHPYLRRRSGLEKPYYPDGRVSQILGKTLGVPIFQEQAMRLAISLAKFTPGEAERLRRAMAAWKSHKGVIQAFKEKIIKGMCENGYSVEFAETCINQIKGFSEYGFPESHAASFALLVYASAWLKRHYPAEFTCALLNSQPMGFYAPAQIVRDAQKHGVEVMPIDANHSAWDTSISYSGTDKDLPRLRLGLRLVIGLRQDHGEALRRSVESHGTCDSISSFWARDTRVSKSTLTILARADAFGSCELNRRAAHWQIQELGYRPAPLDIFLKPRNDRSAVTLPESSMQREMFADYATSGLSLRAHPMQFVRSYLDSKGVMKAQSLSSEYGIKKGTILSAAGTVIIRQRPGTAKGVVFITLEDETGSLNLIIRPSLFERYDKLVMMSTSLLATGKLERTGEVIYIDVSTLESLDTLIRGRACPADVS